MLTHDEICNAIAKTAEHHPIKKASYFGSYADGRATQDSDLDLLLEFFKPRVSLFTLSAIKFDLEDQLKIPVDVVRAPLPDGALIETPKVVPAYG